MDVMLQEHDAKLVLPVPEGLRELSCDITREVLRSQPNNIYQFIADYTSAVLETRDKAREAAIIVHDILETGLTYEAMLQRRGISLEVANRAATIIQAAYRGLLGRRRAQDMMPKPVVFDMDKWMESLYLSHEEIVRRVTKVQAIYRGHVVRMNIKRHAPDISKSLMDFLVEAGVTIDEANRAATLIQRGFRKHLTALKEAAKKLAGETEEETEAAPEGAAEGVEGAEVAPSGEAQSGEAPSGEAPSEEAPTGEAPSGEAPSAEAPSGEAPSEEAPSAEAPSGEAPSEEAPPPAEGAETGQEGQGDQGDKAAEEAPGGETEVAESTVTTEAPDTVAPPSETTEATTDQMMSEVTTESEATTSPETSVVSPEPTTDGTSPGGTETSPGGGTDTEASEMEEEEEE